MINDAALRQQKNQKPNRIEKKINKLGLSGYVYVIYITS